jgi:hypothetical protein
VNLLLLAALLAVAMPKEMARARSQSNRRTRAERQWQTVPPRLPRVRPRAAAPIAVPVSGTYTDATGRKITVSFVVNLLIEDVTPPTPTPTPVPTPTVPTLTGITNTFGVPTTAATSGTILIVKGQSLPTTGILRLQVAGQIAPVSVFASDSITFTVPPGPPGTTTPITGILELFQQTNGTWGLVTKALNFTILPG